MEMEFYVNTDMHVYVYVCVHDDSHDYPYTPSMSRSSYTHKLSTASFCSEDRKIIGVGNNMK